VLLVFFDVMINDTININMSVFVWMYVFISLWYIGRKRITGSASDCA
jgi:hypothetical protein